MQVREIINPFAGVYNTFSIDARRCTLGRLKKRFGKDKLYYRDGVLLSGRVRFDPDDLVVVVQTPGDATAAILVAYGVLLAASLAVGGYYLYQAMHQEIPDFSKVQTSPSLRGSRNSSRQNSHIPLLLGHHRIYPDIASLARTSYSLDDQYLHQLFCFGYSAVQLDLSTLKIGETPFSSFTEATVSIGDGLAKVRCVESTINIKLKYNEPVSRTTASGTTRIEVGITAPSGFYRFDDDGDKRSEQASYRIEWKPVSGDTWTTSHNVSLILCAPSKMRKGYILFPSGDPDERYDVRVTRTTPLKNSSRDVDYLYYDVLRCFIKEGEEGSKPVRNPDLFRLVSCRVKATDQLNGIVDSLNCEGTLKTFSYKGSGTGYDAWQQAETTNPASAILYLLLDPYANPRPIARDRIVWSEFEAFYKFCQARGYECNAWVSSDHTIADLVSYIATTNQASVRRSGGKIGIVIDTTHPSPTQLFTPRNAWDFSEEDNLESTTNTLKVKFVDASSGYVEVERYVSLKDDGTVELDKKDTSGDDVTEMTLFGVTNATQAAKIGKVRLLEMRNRYRTFSWSCDMEGLLCVPGDMVLLEHDTFLLGSGEGRVRSIRRDGSGNVASITLDSSIPLSTEQTYGLTIRNTKGITRGVRIVSSGTRTDSMELAEAMNLDVEVGDLVAVGVVGKETRELLVSSVERGDDMSCQITAVDYAPECYEEGEIKEFDSGITVPPTGGLVGAGAVLPTGDSLPGEPGVGIAGITYTYAVTQEQAEPAPDDITLDAIPPMSASDKYLWLKQVIAYTSGESKTTVSLVAVYGDTGATGPKGEKGDTGAQGAKGETGAQGPKGDKGATGAIGPQGPQGAKGETGATGTSIIGIVEEYALSSSSSSVTGTWGSSVPTLTSTNKYLWNRSKTKYSDSTTSAYTTPIVIGVYGDKGDTGATGPQGAMGASGRGISSITEYYLASASPTAPSASDTGWSTTPQTPTTAKPYLWNKTVLAYTTGSPTTTIAMIGQSLKGDKGAKGETGATGAAAKDFTLYQSSTFFEVSPRGVTHKMQVVSITCVPLNITSPSISWSVSSAVPTQAISSDKTVLSLTVQSGVALADLTVTCSVSGIGTKTIKILATPVGDDGPIYLGTDWEETAATTDNGDPLRRGDYYLRSNDTMIRVYNGSAWENVTENTATQQMMMDVTSTALRDGADVKTSSKVLYEYIGRLAAQSAFISRLQARHITLTQTNDGEGSIQSDKYHWNDTVDNVAHVYYGWKINHDGTSFFTNMNARDINIQDGAFVIHDKQGNLACMSTDGNSDAEESHIARTSTLNAYLLKDLVETATELHRSSTDILLYAYLTLGSSTVAKGRCAYVTADQRLSLPSFTTHLQYISFSFNWDDSNTISKYVWGTAYNGDSNGRQDFTPTYSGTYTLRITGKYIRILGDLSTTRYSYSQFPREDIGTDASSIDPYKTVSYVKTVEMTAGTTYYIAYQAICAYAPNGAYKSIGECSATFTAQVNYTGEKGLVFIDMGAYLKATTNVVPVDVCYDESSNAGHIQVNLENNGYKHYYSSSVLAYTYARDFLASLSDIYGIYTTADKYTTTVVVDGVATEVEHDAPRTYSEGGVTVSSGYSEIAVSAGELSLAKQSSTYVLPASRYVKGLVYLEFYKTGYKRGMAVANLNATEEDSQIGTTSKPFAHVYAGNVDLSHNLFCGMILWYLCSKDAEGTVIPPTGFLLLDNSFSISRSGSYAALFARIEQAGAVGEGKVFHYGSDNKTIVAPDVEGRYLRIGNNGDSGNLIAAGLPDIVGSMKLLGHTDYLVESVSGAFHKTAYYESGNGYKRSNTGGHRTIEIKASLSNSIYGESTSVTPKTMPLHLIIGY